MERDLSHTTLDELKVDDFPIRAQFRDEAVVVTGLSFSVDIRDEVFFSGGIPDKAIRSLQPNNLRCFTG